MSTAIVVIILICLVGLSINKMRKTSGCSCCSKRGSCAMHQHHEPDSHNLCGH